jgi:hypothetical protein
MNGKVDGKNGEGKEDKGKRSGSGARGKKEVKK